MFQTSVDLRKVLKMKEGKEVKEGCEGTLAEPKGRSAVSERKDGTNITALTEFVRRRRRRVKEGEGRRRERPGYKALDSRALSDSKGTRDSKYSK